MEACIIYPDALGGLKLSEWRRFFQVMPVTVNTIQDKMLGCYQWHDYLQIWYTVSGSYYHTVNGIQYRQDPGSVILVFPYMMHRIDTTETDITNAVILQIFVKKNALEARNIPFFAQSFHSACFDSILLPQYKTLCGAQKIKADAIGLALLEEYSKKLNMNPYKMLMLTGEFLTLCTHDSNSQKISKCALQKTQEKKECLDEAMTFLVHNSARYITLDEISKAAMMSRRSFTSNFGEMVGQSCHDYLRSLRMRNAVEFLRKTRKSIQETAEESGFYDSSHFYKVCMELYGVSPLTLRRDLSQWTREHGDRIYRRTIQENGWALAIDEKAMKRHQCAMSFY